MRALLVVVAVALLCCTLAVSAAPVPPKLANNTLGDRLLRTFLVFRSMPLTLSAAQQAGWRQYDYWGTRNLTCDNQVGLVYTSDGKAPTKTSPTMLGSLLSTFAWLAVSQCSAAVSRLVCAVIGCVQRSPDSHPPLSLLQCSTLLRTSSPASACARGS